MILFPILIKNVYLTSITRYRKLVTEQSALLAKPVTNHPAYFTKLYHNFEIYKWPQLASSQLTAGTVSCIISAPS